MKFASSIRYGGQLIDASDCDYNSYKHLGLLCPECKSPVFLREEHHRITPKSKQSVCVSASFNHFKAVDPAQVLRCEARVGAYDRSDLERRASIARNQRLRLLHRWFWDIFWKQFVEEIYEREAGAIEELRELLDRSLGQFSSNIPGFAFLIKNFRHFDHLTNCQTCINGFKFTNTFKPQSGWFKKGLTFISKADVQMQALIATEVLNFLGAKSSHTLLEKTLVLILIRYSSDLEIEQKQLLAPELPRRLYSKLLIEVCFIDWASEFQSRSNF